MILSLLVQSIGSHIGEVLPAWDDEGELGETFQAVACGLIAPTVLAAMGVVVADDLRPTLGWITPCLDLHCIGWVRHRPCGCDHRWRWVGYLKHLIHLNAEHECVIDGVASFQWRRPAELKAIPGPTPIHLPRAFPGYFLGILAGVDAAGVIATGRFVIAHP